MSRIRSLAVLTLALGCAASAAWAATPTLLYTVTGQTYGSQIGRAVAGAGDVDGDGHADFIVGSPGFNWGSTHLLGYAEVYSGATGERLFRVDGEVLDDLFGISVGSAGDWNGDGRDDFFVGADWTSPGGRQNAGSVFIYSGRDGALLKRFDGPEARMAFGISVAIPGDVDGDGHSDLLVGAPVSSPGGRDRAGSVLMYSGATGALLWRVDGPAAGDGLGWSVSRAGDVNRDGWPDVIAGGTGPIDTGKGVAYVLAGGDGALLYVKEGASPDDRLGWSVAGAGDVDGDGWPDFMAGAPFASTGSFTRNGQVLIWSGASGVQLRTMNGVSDQAAFGMSVAGIGDVDGDGRDDVIVGAPYALGLYDYYNHGAAYVFSGRTGAIAFQVGPDDGMTARGSGVAGAGDVNGDGRADVLVGSQLFDYTQDPESSFLIAKGRVEVYSLPAPIRAAAVDVKPGACPNTLNAGSHGMLSVAVLGAAGFDAGEIDPATVRLSGSYAVRSAPQITDTESPAPGGPGACACPVGAADGFVDRAFQFSIADLAWRLGPVRDGDTKTLTLSGAMKDGSRFEGKDCVVIQANRKLAAAAAGAAGPRLLVAGANPIRRGEAATLSLRVPEGGADVDVAVFSVTGRKVADLARGFHAAGLHSIRWDGRLAQGSASPAGIYFARARVAGEDSNVRILILP